METRNRLSLEERIRQEFDAADRRTAAVQEEAGRRVRELEARHDRFEEISRLLVENSGYPLKTLANHFDNAELKRSQDRSGYHSKMRFGHTPRFPATVELKFDMTHDEEVRKLVLHYQVSILPVFIEFERSDQIAFDLDDIDEEKVRDWIDDKVVTFVNTYLKIPFADRYQKNNLVTDPVAGVRFPRNLAKAEVEHEGHTYFFLSAESRERFEQTPDEYVQS